MIQKGFTLVEMVVVLGIFSVMTSVVVFNYGKFSSDTILTNMAYELSLAVREAQIYGVSVRNPNGTVGTAEFSKPYGVNFPVVDGGATQYYLFADKNNNGVYDDSTCVANSSTGECVTPYSFQRGVRITAIKTGSCVLDTNGLSIVFRRPNPEAVIDNSTEVEKAEITLTAPDGAKRYVIVRNNGQIYVSNESVCS